MTDENPLTWRKLLNGIGSALVAYFVVFLLLAFVLGPLGVAGVVVAIVVGAVVTYGLYVFFERV